MQIIKGVNYLLVIFLLLSGCANKVSIPNTTSIKFTYNNNPFDVSSSFNVIADSEAKERELDSSYTLIKNEIITSKALNNIIKIIHHNAKDSVPSNKLSLLKSTLQIQIYQENNVVFDYYLQDSLNYLGTDLIQEIKTSGYCVENAIVLYYLNHYRQLDSVSYIR